MTGLTQTKEEKVERPLPRAMRRAIAKQDIMFYKRLKKMQQKAVEYQKEFTHLTMGELLEMQKQKMSKNKANVLNWYINELNKQTEENNADSGPLSEVGTDNP